jgi:hypothetical protein
MRDVYAARAVRAYAAMQRRFHTRSGVYRRDSRFHPPGAAAHLWPFSRAIVATLDLAGIDHDLTREIDLTAAIADRMRALDRYWDPDREPPAYSSDLRGSRIGGDRYYDDNAWIGLALVQLERIRPGSGYLQRAEELLRFAASGWGGGATPSPGGVFWVEQGRGIGIANHDRNLVSTAPNAELGLHIAELQSGPPSERAVNPSEMYDWVLATLDASKETVDPGTGPFWDKLRGDGTIDHATWSYNQGSMVGLNVLLARRRGGGGPEYLRRAEKITRRALGELAGAYERQPAAFNAIFFRNLLLLHAATADGDLRAAMIEALRGYVDQAWNERRERGDLFHLSHGGVTLLNQSAIVQLLALLAWHPDAYRQLA